MLEIPNDQFQLEPIYKPIPVGIWANRLESLLEHVAVNLKIWKKNTKNLKLRKSKYQKKPKPGMVFICWNLNLHLKLECIYILTYVNVDRMTFQTYQMYW